MDDNLSIMTELYDIKRQNADWEIKLEANTDLFTDTIDGQSDHSANSKLDISLVPSLTTGHDMTEHRLSVHTDCNQSKLNGNGLIIHAKSVPKTSSPKSRRSASNHEYDGIKNVEQFVERRKINGITWYYCLWHNCAYGSNKSNHLVRHIRGHTGERPYACDWPNCGKKFTDSWKRKDHILSHNKKMISITKSMPSLEQKADNNSLNNFVDMLNTNSNICEPIDLDIDVKPELGIEVKDSERDDDSNQSLNMFIPEVIVNEIEPSVDNVLHNGPNPMPDDVNAIQQYIERTTKDGKVWYLCKFSPDCKYGSIKNQHLIRHLRSIHHYGVRPFVCEWPECGKSFTEAYKLKEHQLTHYRKLITTVGNNNKSSMNLVFDAKNDFEDNKIIISDAMDSIASVNGVHNRNNAYHVNRMTFNVSDAQTAQLLTPKKVVMSIKNVEQFVERRKIDGITRYFCQWPNCSYNSNKSNHLVRHITSHTNERKEVCDWPGCGKKFSDVWKLRDHVSHGHITAATSISATSATTAGTSLLTSTPIANALTVTTIADHKKEMPTIYTPNPHKFLIQSLSSPPLPSLTPRLPALQYPPNYDKSNAKSKSPVDIVMSIKNVEQYVERRKVNGITFYFCKWDGCSYGSNKSNHLVRHVRSHTGERPYSCDECDKKFTDSWKLKDHKSIHAKKNLERSMGEQKMLLLSLLQQNCQPVAQNDSQSDLFANELIVPQLNFDDSFVDGSDDKSNLDLEDNDQDFNEIKEEIEDETKSFFDCVDNSSEMPEMDLLVPQVIIDESDDAFGGIEPNQSPVNDLSKSILHNQLNIKSVQQLTDESFAGVLSIKNVEQYVDKVLQSDGNWYVCKWITCPNSAAICGFSTQKSSYITQHVYRHLGERPYKCQWTGCTAKFNKKQNLKLHMTCHTGEQTFRCSHPNCYYTAISAEALRLHSLKHLTNKCFQCKWNGCGLQFATQIELLRHSKLHSGVRLHSCHFPNCDYASKYRNKLQIHIRRHTNTKPYVCQIENCGKSFIVKDKLRRHETSVHKEFLPQQVIQL